MVLGEAVCLPPFPPPNIHAQDVEFVPCTAEGSWRRSLFQSHLSRRRGRSSSAKVAGLEVKESGFRILDSRPGRDLVQFLCSVNGLLFKFTLGANAEVITI